MFSSPYRVTHFDTLLQNAGHFPHIFAPRAEESHKGTYGTLAVIGGAEGMSGAVVLAASAAIYSGCGKVWAGFNQKALPFPVIPERPEIMLDTAAGLQQRQDIGAWVLGCGLGLGSTSVTLLRAQLAACRAAPLLLDADALTLLAHHPDLADQAVRQTPLVLTPHPAEAARLLSCTTAAIQADRSAAARQIAQKFHAHTVLKGRHTIVCSPNGSEYINRSGNPGLATAGSGDVLSGIIGSLLAQGVPVGEAVCGGVWLHGAAADVLRDSGIGEIGMLAGELAAAARWLRNRMIAAVQTA
ncbi:NAD(P)H-hydrate dehydratase [Uruburuella testudinis]|uniref:ADP-dependent (S)-NAD(P)H-hydrate dehydratase n=1 Tax=Uruburuella testudinis TaxID=1282863 RepID=A0ABY4E005_9NEIS|nr:NAD(P)H-hydrate dehydratase [Uruburuella testudinis]UOO83142.1 NAD(P)H-hydrate dehydratase [Uruburuella testudinis]